MGKPALSHCIECFEPAIAFDPGVGGWVCGAHRTFRNCHTHRLSEHRHLPLCGKCGRILCPSCGAEVVAKGLFCHRCGQKVLYDPGAPLSNGCMFLGMIGTAAVFGIGGTLIAGTIGLVSAGLISLLTALAPALGVPKPGAEITLPAGWTWFWLLAYGATIVGAAGITLGVAWKLYWWWEGRRNLKGTDARRTPAQKQ